jgi:hypothetical protein
VQGLGPKTLRALALVAELVYGTPASTHDPARFACEHGGKDGTPYPVERETYDRTIDVMNAALRRSHIDRSEHPNTHLTDCVAALDHVVRKNRLALFKRAGHFSLRHEHPPAYRVVFDYEAWIERLVPPRSSTDEVHERDLQLVGRAKSSVVSMIDVSYAIGVENPIRRLFVRIR